MPSLQLALRAIARRPGAHVIRAATLGVGLAAFAAATSVTDGLLLRPLPFPNARRIVHLDAPVSGLITRPDVMAGILRAAAATPLLEDRSWVGRRQVFATDSALPTAEALATAFVSPRFFSQFGASPMLGRTFVDADRSSNPVPVVISERLWLTTFGGDITALGRPRQWPDTTDDDTWTIVGVMPTGFTFPGETDIWLPYHPDAFLPTLVPTYATLAAGASVDQLRRALPGVVVTPLREHVRPHGAAGVWSIWFASLCLLLVCVVHTSTLTAAIHVRRQPDVALKHALGADHRSMRVEFLAEYAFLIGVAVSCTVLLTHPLVAALTWFLPVELTRGQWLAPGERVLLLTAAAGTGAVGLLTVAELRRLRSGGDSGGLGDGLRATATKAVPQRSLVLQVALSIAVVYASGLVQQSYALLTQRDLGFDPDGLLAVPMPVPASTRGLPPEVARSLLTEHASRVQRSLEAVKSAPNVRHAAFASGWPASPPGTAQAMRVGSRPDAEVHAVRWSVSVGVVETLGARLTAGREATATEAETLFTGPTRLALVNESLARRLEPFGNPVGQQLSSSPALTYQIVGVVADLATHRADARVPMLFAFVPAGSRVLLVRGERAAAGVTAAMRRVWPDQPEVTVLSVRESVAASNATTRASTVLLSAIGLACALLTLVAVSTHLSLRVHTQKRTIAVRLALGGSRSSVRWWLLRSALAPTAIGLAGGLTMGAVAGYLMRSVVWAVSPLDGAVAAGTTVVALISIATGVWLPQRRALRCDPARLLR